MTAFDITFQVQAVQCEKVLYGLQEPLSLSWETGAIGPVSGTLKVSGLSPLTDYTLLVQGIGPQGEEGNVVRLPFSTSKGPDDLYPWEQARNGIPSSFTHFIQLPKGQKIILRAGLLPQTANMNVRDVIVNKK